MLTVENDWITYEMGRVDVRAAGAAVAAAPARRVAVRGGSTCAQRVPVVQTRVASAAARPGARPVATTRPARLRLTRRGRFVLVVMPALLALSGALIAVSVPGIAEASPRASVMPNTVVVGSGDSLWTIAERIAPHTDPRVTVAAIRRANDLHGSVLAAGSVLVLPAR